MMALILGDRTHPVGEGQRVGKAWEVEDSLEPSDPVAFHEVPVRDLARELGDLGLGRPRRIAAAGNAAFPRQCLDRLDPPGQVPPRSGPPPQARIEPCASCDTLYLPAWSLLECFVATSHDPRPRLGSPFGHRA